MIKWKCMIELLYIFANLHTFFCCRQTYTQGSRYHRPTPSYRRAHISNSFVLLWTILHCLDWEDTNFQIPRVCHQSTSRLSPPQGLCPQASLGVLAIFSLFPQQWNYWGNSSWPMPSVRLASYRRPQRPSSFSWQYSRSSTCLHSSPSLGHRFLCILMMI